MIFFGHHLKVPGDFLSFKCLGDPPPISFTVRCMFEFKGLVNNVVVGEEEELQHFLMMKKELIAEIGLGVCLKVFPFSHYWGIKI